MDRCVNCQYYDRQNKGQGVGQCRRTAPALSPINAKAYMIEGVWPTVRDDDWCGEWKVAGRRVDPRVADFVAAGMGPPATSPAMRTAVAPASSTSPMAALAIGATARGND